MGVTTRADEVRYEAVDCITKAILALRQIEDREVYGSDEFTEAFQGFISAALRDLRRMRRELER